MSPVGRVETFPASPGVSHVGDRPDEISTKSDIGRRVSHVGGRRGVSQACLDIRFLAKSRHSVFRMCLSILRLALASEEHNSAFRVAGGGSRARLVSRNGRAFGSMAIGTRVPRARSSEAFPFFLCDLSLLTVLAGRIIC